MRKSPPFSTPMISISQAFETIDRETPRLGTESLDIGYLTDRILAEDIIADSDMPPFDRSQMDGFAVIAADTVNAPVVLNIAGESAAGRGWHGKIAAGEAVRIMTGAPVPSGADAVQKLELTAESKAPGETGESIRILEPTSTGKYIIARGSETPKGTKVLAAGTRVTASMIAAIAAFGYSRVEAGKVPSVSILSTGSEIVPVAEMPQQDQIRNSNSPMLAALVRRAGGVATEFPIAGDDVGLLTSAIANAADNADILVVTGGVSVGKYDLTKDVLRSLGAEIFFERVSLKPGKPAVFARLGKTLVFGLPGNPVSAAVTFHLFVRRAMQSMQGAAEIGLRSGFAVAAKKAKAAVDRDTYLPAAIETDKSGRAVAVPLKWLGSSDFIGFARAGALIFIPAGRSFEPGDVVRTFRI